MGRSNESHHNRYPPPGSQDVTRWLHNQSYMIRSLGLDRDEHIKDMLWVGAFADDAEIRASVAEALHMEIAEALIELDCFAPHPTAEKLTVPGIALGRHIPSGYAFHWGYAEQRYSILVLGSPGQGKTTLVCWIIEKLSQDPTRHRASFWIWDLRFDYVGLAQILPNTKAIWMSQAKWNVLKPPSGVPPKTWFAAFAGKLADSLVLMVAGREFLSRHLTQLYVEEFQKAERWPTVFDLILYFEDLTCQSLDERGYKARVTEKLRVLHAACPEMLDCESGYDFEALLERRCNVVFVMADLDKNIGDLLTTVMMDTVYYRRMFNDEKVHHPIFFVLDEQRHLLRERRWD